MLVDFDILPDKSRLWIYAAEQKLTNNQQIYILDFLSNHLESWQAHKLPLMAGVTILEDYFIVVALDETQSTASGCAIDTLQNKIQQVENKLLISLMNRTNIFCVIEDIIQCISISNIDKKISKETLFYDLTVQTKSDLNLWLKPIKEGWCNKFLS